MSRADERGLRLIKVMVNSAYCPFISAHWHYYNACWLIKRGGCQGVTGIGRFTWYCYDLTLITFPGLLLLVSVILAWKIMHFQALWVKNPSRFFSLSAKSARRKNHSSSLTIIFSANIWSIFIILFSLAPHMSGVLDIPAWAKESSPFVLLGMIILVYRFLWNTR